MSARVGRPRRVAPTAFFTVVLVVVALAAVVLALVVTLAVVVFAFDATFAVDFFTAVFVLATDFLALSAVFVVVDFFVVAMLILSFVFKPRLIDLSN
jgi:hypothetical protein